MERKWREQSSQLLATREIILVPYQTYDISGMVVAAAVVVVGIQSKTNITEYSKSIWRLIKTLSS